MTGYTTFDLWLIIAFMAIGTFLIRFSFIGGPLARRQLPDWMLRHLRYAPVAVLPGMVAPLVLWPDATGGSLDPVRLTAALVAVAIGYTFKKTILAFFAGVAVFYALPMLMG